jgi:hypothetical protein
VIETRELSSGGANFRKPSIRLELKVSGFSETLIVSFDSFTTALALKG